MKYLISICVLAMFSVVACSSEQEIQEGQTVYEVDNAYIVAPAPGMKNTSGGLHISVQGASSELLDVSSDLFSRIELHTMSMTDGKMSMRRVDSFPVSEDAPLELKRGGNHLMLFGLTETLEVDSEIDLTLTFKREDGATQVLITKAIVKDLGAE